MALLGSILLVDDSPADVDLLLRVFQQLAIQTPIHVCSSGAEAMDYMNDDRNPIPTIVLLDLKMPGFDGFGVLHRIRSNPKLQHLIVIVLTTSEDIYDVHRAYQFGANSFLTKPFNLEDFRELISGLHQYWFVSNKSVLTAPPPPRPDSRG